MHTDTKDFVLKTGTTILGIVCKEGIVMASDRQGTLGGQHVFEKNTRKTTQVNEYILISGAGSAAGIRLIERIVPAELKMRELRTKTRPSVKEAANLAAAIIAQNQIPSAILMGGFNEDGSFELYSILPDGYVRFVPDYDASIGSGMMYAIGLLEREYKENITIKDGVELAKEALKSSTQRDTASGYGIDVFTVTKEGIKKVVEQEITPKYVDQ